MPVAPATVQRNLKIFILFRPMISPSILTPLQFLSRIRAILIMFAVSDILASSRSTHYFHLSSPCMVCNRMENPLTYKKALKVIKRLVIDGRNWSVNSRWSLGPISIPKKRPIIYDSLAFSELSTVILTSYANWNDRVLCDECENGKIVRKLKYAVEKYLEYAPVKQRQLYAVHTSAIRLFILMIASLREKTLVRMIRDMKEPHEAAETLTEMLKMLGHCGRAADKITMLSLPLFFPNTRRDLITALTSIVLNRSITRSYRILIIEEYFLCSHPLIFFDDRLFIEFLLVLFDDLAGLSHELLEIILLKKYNGHCLNYCWNDARLYTILCELVGQGHYSRLFLLQKILTYRHTFSYTIVLELENMFSADKQSDDYFYLFDLLFIKRRFLSSTMLFSSQIEILELVSSQGKNICSRAQTTNRSFYRKFLNRIHSTRRTSQNRTVGSCEEYLFYLQVKMLFLKSGNRRTCTYLAELGE